MSIGGGLGGPGGIGGGEPKVTKGVSGVGEPSQSDVNKFNFTLSGEQGNEGGKINIQISEKAGGQKMGGPMEFQIKEAQAVEKPGMGKVAVKEIENMVSMGRNKENELMEKMQVAGKDGGTLSTGQMLEIQFELGQYTTLIDVVSKGVGKVVQAAQTVIKQQ